MATKHNDKGQNNRLNRAQEILAPILRGVGVVGGVGVVFIYTLLMAIVFEDVIGDAIAGTAVAFWIEATMAVPPTAAAVVMAIYLSDLLNDEQTNWSETVIHAIGAAWVISPVHIWTYYTWVA